VLVSSKPIVLVGLIVMVMHFLHAGQEHDTLPCMEEPMTTLRRGARPHSNIRQQRIRS
jgi:hypothetical protein